MPRKTFSDLHAEISARYPSGQTAGGVSVDDIVQLRLQNTWDTHLDIAREMAVVMRADMAAYDADASKFTQSLGCWSGFHAQQMIKAVKRMRGTAKGTYVYLSGWMVAGLRNRWGHLPDQSMHEKTAVADLIEEIYTSLRQADEVAMNDLFRALKAAGSDAERSKVIDQIDNFETHVVPIIADIDAGFGNEHATYLLAKELIKAGACCLQIENQVSDAKQCGHQDGKVTVPREDFIEKLRACRLAFEELGVDEGVIVARTDSLGAGLTQKVPVSQRPGDLASQYIKWLKTEQITEANPIQEGELAIFQGGEFVKPVRLPNGLFPFQEGTGRARVIEDCIASLRDGGAECRHRVLGDPRPMQAAMRQGVGQEIGMQHDSCPDGGTAGPGRCPARASRPLPRRKQPTGLFPERSAARAVRAKKRTGRCPQPVTWKIASISTATPRGRAGALTAARAWRPASPKTSTIRSEQPLMTSGWSVKPGVEFTKPVSLTT